MPPIDINRLTEGVNLPPEVAGTIWQDTQETSAVMAVTPSIPLPGSGMTVPVITGDPEAGWVGETDPKPVDRPSIGRKDMTPYKLAVIVPFSTEFLRDASALYNALVSRIPGALGRKFDETVFGAEAAPGSNFDTLDGVTAVGIAGNTWAGLVAADAAVALGGGVLNGFALSPQGRSVLLGSVDGSGRPLFLADTTGPSGVPTVMGHPVYLSRSLYADGGADPNTLGYAGDWTAALYGTVEGVRVTASTEASIDDGGEVLHLWQRNMIAIRAEVEVGFVIRTPDAFVRLTDDEQAA